MNSLIALCIALIFSEPDSSPSHPGSGRKPRKRALDDGSQSGSPSVTRAPNRQSSDDAGDLLSHLGISKDLLPSNLPPDYPIEALEAYKQAIEDRKLKDKDDMDGSKKKRSLDKELLTEGKRKRERVSTSLSM